MATREQKEQTVQGNEADMLRAKVEELEAQMKMRDMQEAAAAEAERKAKDDPRRMVTVELFKDNGKYKDAVYVNVNNYNALIPRGVRVSVPYYVYMHIQEMLKQDAATANMIRMYEAEWERSAMAAGM